MKILILGGDSFIGKYYYKFSKLTNLLRSSREKKRNTVNFDICKNDINKIIKKDKITHVVILLAISNPLECQTFKKKSNFINVVMTKKLIDKLIKNKIYFIFFSSEYVFDGLKGNYSEKSKKKTKLLYGKQKLIIEKYLHKKNYKNFSVLRISKTFGDDLNDNSIFTNFLKNNFKFKKNYFFSFDQKFSPLYIKDLIKIIDIFFKKKIRGYYNVCSDEHNSRLEYMEKIVKKFKLKKVNLYGKKFSNFSSLKSIPLNVTMNNNKIKKKINFKFTGFNSYLNLIKKKYEKNIKI